MNRQSILKKIKNIEREMRFNLTDAKVKLDDLLFNIHYIDDSYIKYKINILRVYFLFNENNLKQSIELLMIIKEKLVLENQNILIVEVLREIGKFYYLIGDYNLAINNLYEALDILTKEKRKDEIWKIYNNIGDIYSKLNEGKDAIKYYKKAIREYKNIEKNHILLQG